ncbi:MAG: DUF444 family protein [Clostridia bacterium]|nr:DUF444 family protein [Clostridia bacterium]
MKGKKGLGLYGERLCIAVRGFPDWRRHQEILKGFLEKEFLENIYEEEYVVENGEGKIFRVLIPFVKNYGFKFDGAGAFSLGLGQETDRRNFSKGEAGAPAGKEGSLSGAVFHKTLEEFFHEDLKEIDFKEWALPKPNKKISVEGEIKDGDVEIVSHGGGCPDRRRTVMENLKRNALRGFPTVGGFSPGDFRYRVPSFKEEDPDFGFLFILDASASMELYHRHLARMMFFLTQRFLKARYKKVKILYLTHNTRAEEVEEADFFQRPSYGGTKYSSAYELALKIMERDFISRGCPAFVLHLTDGNNLPSDNQRSRYFLERLLKIADRFLYGEIFKGNSQNPSMFFYYLRFVKNKNFLKFRAGTKKQALSVLRKIFSPAPKG